TMTPGSLPRGVGLTALGAARGRAAESARADRLCDDPYAARFVAAAAQAGVAFAERADVGAAQGRADHTDSTGKGRHGAEPRGDAGADAERVDLRPLIDAYVGVRTRFFDDALLEAVQGGARQVVILGAGLDARAFRLEWPDGTRLFEVDTPDVFQFKEPV